MGINNRNKKRSFLWRVFSLFFKIIFLCIFCMVGLAIIGVIVGPQDGQNLSTEINAYQSSGKNVTQKQQTVIKNEIIPPKC